MTSEISGYGVHLCMTRWSLFRIILMDSIYASVRFYHAQKPTHHGNKGSINFRKTFIACDQSRYHQSLDVQVLPYDTLLTVLHKLREIMSMFQTDLRVQ